MAVYRPIYKDQKTGELKQQRVWWYEFSFASRRVRESSKSTRKTIAVEAEDNRRRELQRAYAGQGAPEPAAERTRTVRAAMEVYQQTYPVNHRAKSVAVVKERAPHLEKHLGSLLMPDLTEERIKRYMAERRKEGASNRTINIELAVLSRAVGSKWGSLWPKLKHLEENHDVGRALEPAEEKAILETAARNQSRLIHPFLYALTWTGMRSDEARTLHWGQVNFEAAEIRVGKAKTEAGKGRRIPMSANLKAVLSQHASWYASKFGLLEPDWYVFPRCRRETPIDPTQPVGSLNKAWESVRKAAGVKCRLHDFRHSFCTKLAEAGVPESTMLDIMGHVSTAMLRRYSHIRAQARREAIDAVESHQIWGAVPKVSTKVSDFSRAQAAVTN